MDKVQKIREEVVRLRNLHQMKYQRLDASDNICLVECGKRNLCDNLLEFIDSLQEEPVSEDLNVAADKYESEQQEKYKDRDNHDFDNYRDGFVDGLTLTYDAFKAGAQWQKTKEEPVSEDLEEASKEWLKPQLDKSYATYGETKQMELTRFDGYAMLDAIEFGAEWQKTKDQSTIELAEDHAMLAGMEKMKEEMMKGAVEGYVTLTMTGVPTVAATVPEGKYNFDDKVKLVIIKED